MADGFSSRGVELESHSSRSVRGKQSFCKHKHQTDGRSRAPSRVRVTTKYFVLQTGMGMRMRMLIRARVGLRMHKPLATSFPFFPSFFSSNGLDR